MLSSFYAAPGPTGAVERLHGFMVDLTRHLREESRDAVEGALQGALAHRAVIEQAKGIIMAVLGVDAEKAFALLSARSQHTNLKLHAVAAALVSAAGQGESAALLAQWHRSSLG